MCYSLMDYGFRLRFFMEMNATQIYILLHQINEPSLTDSRRVITQSEQIYFLNHVNINNSLQCIQFFNMISLTTLVYFFNKCIKFQVFFCIWRNGKTELLTFFFFFNERVVKNYKTCSFLTVHLVKSIFRFEISLIFYMRSTLKSKRIEHVLPWCSVILC